MLLESIHIFFESLQIEIKVVVLNLNQMGTYRFYSNPYLFYQNL